MNAIFQPGASLLYMKVGKHAQESLADIVLRKTREIEEAGFGLWGYGGNTCHPLTMVQPFARQAAKNGQPIHLVMEEMQSGHDASPVCSAEYSTDKINWNTIPKPIRVHGSNFALAIKNLRVEEFELPLTQTRVAVGPSQGRNGGQYIIGQVDKACLNVLPAKELVNVPGRFERNIGLVADLIEPYSVFLRGARSS